MLNILQSNINNLFSNAVKNGDCLYTTNYSIQTDEATGLLTNIDFPEFSITYGKLNLLKSISIPINRGEENCVRLFFALKGHTSINIDIQNGKESLECNQHNIFFIPKNCTETLTSGMCNDCNACKEWRFLCIDIEPDFFQKYLNPQNPIFQPFAKDIKQNLFAQFCPNNLLLDLQMHEIIQEIMDIKITQMYERLHLNSLVLKLLSKQFEQIENYKCPAISGMRESDIEKIYKAREILVSCMNEPCPLVELALKVGTNECTLKKGFKEVFGYTVFNYLQEIKMQQAKKYLLEGNRNITEISEEMGYKNPTHFTFAFKKRFGTLPSKLKTLK